MTLRIGTVSRWLELVIFALVGATIVYFLSTRPSDPRTAMVCIFTERAGAAPTRIPSNGTVIRQLRIEGTIENTAQQELVNFDGSASWSDRGDRAARVNGAIFPAADGTVKGLTAEVAHPDFARHPLRIVTLNGRGIMDFDRTTAYLYFAPEERLSHPMTYACASDRR